MPSYRLVLFDLDGTLIDSQRGVALSLRYALARMNVPEDGLDDVTRFIGPPIAQTFSESYGLDQAATRRAVELYRRHYGEIGIHESPLYEGMFELLSYLQGQGVTLALATSKLGRFAEEILRRHGVDRLFTYVAGADSEGARERKEDIIRAVLAEAGWTDRRAAVMVGDHPSDILGARANGIEAVAVTWGYGSTEALEAAGPRWMARSVTELRAIVLSGGSDDPASPRITQ